MNNRKDFLEEIEQHTRKSTEKGNERIQKAFEYHFNFIIERLKFVGAVNGYYLAAVSILLATNSDENLIITEAYLYWAIGVSIFGFISSLILLKNEYDKNADFFLGHIGKILDTNKKHFDLLKELYEDKELKDTSENKWDEFYVEKYLKKIPSIDPSEDSGKNYLGEYVVILTNIVILLSFASLFEANCISVVALICSILCVVYFSVRSDLLNVSINSVGGRVEGLVK
jgi:hypothetical protein